MAEKSISVTYSDNYQGDVFGSIDDCSKEYFSSKLFQQMLSFASRFNALAKFGKDRLFFELSGDEFEKRGNSSRLLFGYLLNNGTISIEFVTRKSMANNLFSGNQVLECNNAAYDEFISLYKGCELVTEVKKQWISLRVRDNWALISDMQLSFIELFNIPESDICIKTIERDFYLQVIEANVDRESRLNRLTQASTVPEAMVKEIVIYKRNPDVVAEALFQAKGICQGCNKAAPFNRKTDSTPYLEVHHIKPLSAGGPDSMDNVIALCPNCHRQQHYG